MTTKEKQALEDRGLIRWQMLLGSGLIAFGALSIPLFQVSGVLEGQTATAAFAVAWPVPRRATAKRTSCPRTASNMPRTLRQLWAEEDEAREPEPRRRQRRTRPPARQVDRRRSGRQPRRTAPWER
jgi:hypothetical protein